MDSQTEAAWQVIKQACEMVSTTRAGHVQIQQACEHVEKLLLPPLIPTPSPAFDS